MNKCRICNEDLFNKISFTNLFNMNLTEHVKCRNNLLFNMDSISFPITNNLIYYDYAFYDLNPKYNTKYLETIYLGKIIKRNLENEIRSIILVYGDRLFSSFSGDDYKILFSLSNRPFLLISLVYFDLSEIVHKYL